MSPPRTDSAAGGARMHLPGVLGPRSVSLCPRSVSLSLWAETQ